MSARKLSTLHTSQKEKEEMTISSSFSSAEMSPTERLFALSLYLLADLYPDVLACCCDDVFN
jgi:hypothetical protein